MCDNLSIASGRTKIECNRICVALWEANVLFMWYYVYRIIAIAVSTYAHIYELFIMAFPFNLFQLK